jgi:hypothetical protein
MMAYSVGISFAYLLHVHSATNYTVGYTTSLSRRHRHSGILLLSLVERSAAPD